MAEEYPAAVTADKHALAGFSERRTAVKGVDIRYFVGGEGAPPIVLVHGLGGAAANWLAVAPELARRHRVLVPDLPGHGGSAGVPGLPTLAPFAEIVHELAAREGAAPGVLVGHSLGAVVALRHAARYADDTLGIVLVSAAGIRSTTRIASVLLALTALVQPGRRLAPHRRRISAGPFLRSVVFGGWGAADPAALTPDAADALLVDVPLHTDVAGASFALVRDDMRPLLGQVRCPALVLWGDRDTQVPLEDAFVFARGLAAGLRVVADCGHLVIVERPLECVDAIEALAAGR
jgi:pimeloyl-ACP methyl ester carboxylesterase